MFGSGAAIALLALAVLGVLTWHALAPLPKTLPPHAVVVVPQLLAGDGTPLTLSHDARFNRYAERPLSAIPTLVRTAFVTSEDRRYWVHGGSDWRARFTAIWQNLKAGHIVRGASTIGEQVARILTPRPRTYWSHWLAGIDANRLIDRFGRSRVLEFYLNQVPYGARRRGVVQAARYYFGRDVSALTPAEQLALAVLVRSPVAYDPAQHPRALRRAVDDLAVRMHTHGAIDAAELSAVRRSAIDPGHERLPVVAGPFVAYARLRLHALGLSASGPVKTTLDAGLERTVQQLLRTRLKAVTDRGVKNAAALIVDNRSGAVLAWAVAPTGIAGDLDPVLVPRQPGSTLKPFLYALAMERLGWQPDTLLRDGPLATRLGDGVHTYRDYSGHYYGQASLRYALANSLNIPAVETARAVGVAPFLDLLHRLGMTALDRDAQHYGPALAIGDGPVPLLELTQAYSALARHGRFLPLHVLAAAPESKPQTVLRPDVTSLIASILSDPDARSAEFGDASVLDLPYATAVKTGTSSNYHDAWTMGFDNRYTVGVWMGRLNGGDMDQITGSAGPALVLRSIFARLRTGQPYAGLWHSPALKRVAVCEHIGSGPCIERNDWHLRETASTPVARMAAVHIVRPLTGETLALDPRVARADQMYAFRLADLPPGSRSVAWYLDGRLLARTHAATYDWRLSHGTHHLSAKVNVNTGQTIDLGPVAFDVQ
ncbi:MAG: transglycosylase domain-containing protein [Gammaproteobacteria bacterium]